VLDYGVVCPDDPVNPTVMPMLPAILYNKSRFELLESGEAQTYHSQRKGRRKTNFTRPLVWGLFKDKNVEAGDPKALYFVISAHLKSGEPSACGVDGVSQRRFVSASGISDLLVDTRNDFFRRYPDRKIKTIFLGDLNQHRGTTCFEKMMDRLNAATHALLSKEYKKLYDLLGRYETAKAKDPFYPGNPLVDGILTNIPVERVVEAKIVGDKENPTGSDHPAVVASIQTSTQRVREWPRRPLPLFVINGNNTTEALSSIGAAFEKAFQGDD
jgi:hypothetical protein